MQKSIVIPFTLLELNAKARTALQMYICLAPFITYIVSFTNAKEIVSLPQVPR